MQFSDFTAAPDLIFLETKPANPECYGFFTQCNYSWPDQMQEIAGISMDAAYYIFKFLLLYSVPMIFILYTYCQIGRVLWTSANIPNHYSGIHHNGRQAVYIYVSPKL